jgi:segregation and condensation protein A
MNIAVDVPQGALFDPVARIYGEPLEHLPQDLYIPPDALAIMLDAFEGPLDLLLYLIRKANVDILDIPMAPLTRQYLDYIESMRATNLELAADYLVMAAMLIEIKSRMLLPRPKAGAGDEAEDPRAELVRRLMEYEQTNCRRPSASFSGSRRWSRSPCMCACRKYRSPISRKPGWPWCARPA